MMNPVPWLQMTNMISYQGLVRTFPCGFIVLADSKDYNPEDWQCSDDNYVYYCEEPDRALAIISNLCTRLSDLAREQLS